MVLLSLVLFALILVSLLDVFKTDLSTKVVLLTIICLVLIFLASFRYGDRDYENYVDIFNSVKPLFNHESKNEVHGEPGYILLNRICKTIGMGSIGVFSIMALCSIGLSLVYFKKNTKFFFIAILIYFSHVFLLRDMLQIRSGLAASISLYSFYYIPRRKLWKFLSVIILACMFHAGAAIMIIAYFFFPVLKDVKARHIFVVTLGFILGLIFSASLIEYFFVEILYIPGVSLYTADSDNFKSLGLLNPVLLKSTALIIILLYYKDQIQLKFNLFQPLLVSLTLSVFWLATFNHFAIFGARLATYLSNVEHLLIPALFYTKINKLLLWFIIVCYCIYMFSAKFETFKDLSFYFLK
jgi:hypothetical protein